MKDFINWANSLVDSLLILIDAYLDFHDFDGSLHVGMKLFLDFGGPRECSP